MGRFKSGCNWYDTDACRIVEVPVVPTQRKDVARLALTDILV
jgi:hypothetical protein